MSKVTGKVSQIIGPVVDVEFQSGADLPKIYDSLENWFWKFNLMLARIR